MQRFFMGRSLRRTARAGAILAAILVAGSTGAGAGVSYDVSVGLDIGDDAKLFLNLTNEQFAPPERVATALVRRCARPADDYPAVLFLAAAGGVTPGKVLDLRLSGLSWAEVMFRLKIGPSVLFAGIRRDPGPPYGRAWGHYRKHSLGKRIDLSDGEIVDLAKLQIASRYYGISPLTIIGERRNGVSVEKFAAARHRNGHRGRHAAPAGGHEKSGKKDRGKSKD